MAPNMAPNRFMAPNMGPVRRQLVSSSPSSQWALVSPGARTCCSFSGAHRSETLCARDDDVKASPSAQ